jgi:hypothetical protein
MKILSLSLAAAVVSLGSLTFAESKYENFEVSVDFHVITCPAPVKGESDCGRYFSASVTIS